MRPLPEKKRNHSTSTGWGKTNASLNNGRRGAPDKLFADGAEGGLREEGGAELVTLDQVNFGLFDGAAPVMEGEKTLALRIAVRLTCRV